MKKSIIGTLITCLLLTGCSSTSSKTDDSQVSDDHYPVTITTYDYEGNEIEHTFTKAPTNTLVVFQSSIETMIALGLEDHVGMSFGLDNHLKEEWAPSLANMNYVEDVFSPDKEMVVNLNPDFILSWSSLFSDKRLGDVDSWIDMGSKTYINTNTARNDNYRTLENEYNDILNIGKIYNVEERANALVDEMKAEVEAAVARKTGDVTVAVVEPYEGSFINYGASSLAGDMIATLGGTLAIENHGTISKEDLVQANPDVIFVMYMENTESGHGDVRAQTQKSFILDDLAFSEMNAVKNNRIHGIMLSEMYASGVRSIDGLKTFGDGMYGNE